MCQPFWRKLFGRDFLPVVDSWEKSYYAILSVTSMAVLYNMCVIITRFAFDFLQQGQFANLWYVFDYLSDIIYIVDMILEARTGILLSSKSVHFRKYIFCHISLHITCFYFPGTTNTVFRNVAIKS